MPASASERAPIPRAAPRRARAALSLITCGAATLLAAILAASCTSALSLDGYQDASDAICALLDDCYAAGAPAGCRDHVRASMSVAAWGDNAEWLRVVAANGCLETCTSARKCMDSTPICSERAAECQAAQDCCGATTGDADCQFGRCCVTSGHRCETDDDCCATACDPESNTCGGTICHTAGDVCAIDDECCSMVCRGNVCADTVCNPDGFNCEKDGECCNRACTSGVCGQPTCKLSATPCSSDGECCEGLQCFRQGEATIGFCSPAACTPLGAECTPSATADTCCEGTQCLKPYFRCTTPCVAGGELCVADAPCCGGVCGPDGKCPADCSRAYCNVDADCCSNTCVSGTCAPECGDRECASHTVCVVGKPLLNSPACDSQGCVALVCKNDPYCCCTAWDAFCVQQALKLGTCSCL